MAQGLTDKRAVHRPRPCRAVSSVVHISISRTSRDMSGLTRHRSDEDSGSIHADQEHGVLINDVGGKLKCICRSDLQIECGGVGLRTVTTKGGFAAEGDVEKMPAGRKFVEGYFVNRSSGGKQAR